MEAVLLGILVGILEDFNKSQWHAIELLFRYLQESKFMNVKVANTQAAANDGVVYLEFGLANNLKS